MAGAILTEAQLDILSDDITFLANPPKVRVYNSAAISHATNAAFQAVTFNSERFDTDTMHSTSVNTDRLTFTTAGTYLVGGCVQFANNGTGVRALRLRLGGATDIALVEQPVGGTDTHALEVSTLYAFTAGQYVTLDAFQSSGGALNMLAQPNSSPEFWAIWQSL